MVVVLGVLGAGGAGLLGEGFAAQPSATDASVALGKAKLIDLGSARAGVRITVPVTYSTPAGASTGRRIRRMKAKIVVRDGSGRTSKLKAKPLALANGLLRTTGLGRQKVHQHLKLAGPDAKTVRQALAGGGKATITTTATNELDSDGDGDVDGEAIQTASSTVSNLTSPASATASEARRGNQSLGAAAAPRGSNPCIYIYDDADCINKRGSVWRAGGFLHSNTQTVSCKGVGDGTYYLVSWITSFFGGDPVFEIDTNAKNFTAGSSVKSGPGNSAYVSMTDYNLRGHPISYTPVVACCKDANPTGTPPVFCKSTAPFGETRKAVPSTGEAVLERVPDG